MSVNICFVTDQTKWTWQCRLNCSYWGSKIMGVATSNRLSNRSDLLYPNYLQNWTGLPHLHNSFWRWQKIMKSWKFVSPSHDVLLDRPTSTGPDTWTSCLKSAHLINAKWLMYRLNDSRHAQEDFLQCENAERRHNYPLYNILFILMLHFTDHSVHQVITVGYCRIYEFKKVVF